MIIESIPYVVASGNDIGKRRIRWRLQCNVCSKEFIKKPSRVKYRRVLHFCSRKCVDKSAHTKQATCSGKKCTNFVSIARYRKTRYCVSCDKTAYDKGWENQPKVKVKRRLKARLKYAEVGRIVTEKQRQATNKRTRERYANDEKLREKRVKYIKAYKKKRGKEWQNAISRRWRERNPSKIATALRRQALFALMGNRCKGCGETDPMFLQIDHVNNDGFLDRKKSLVESRKANQLPNTARTPVSVNKYKENPKRYQLLCANCNYAKHRNGGKLYKPKKKRKVA